MLVHLIVNLILSALLGLICALFSYFLDYTFWKGSIFQFWLPFLAKRCLKAFDPEKAAHIEFFPLDSRPQAYIDNAKHYMIYKVLGGCPVCLNIWIGIISWVVLAIFSPLAWYYGFPYILTASAFIRIFTGNR